MRPTLCIAVLTLLGLFVCPFLLLADEIDRSKETAHLEPAEKAVADWLLSVQRAGWEEHDAKTYNAQWAKDAKLTWGRSAEPGPHDFATDAKQIRATREIIMRADKPDTLIVPTQISVKIEDNTATVDWIIRVGAENATFKTLTAEHYQLVKVDQAWKVKSNRAWVLEITLDGQTTKMTEKEWARRDAAAKQAEERGEVRDLPFLLLDAYRFGDAHDAAVTNTKRNNANAQDWSIRGWMAGIACRADDMLPSFEKARKLDPDVWLPDYAKVEPAD